MTIGWAHKTRCPARLAWPVALVACCAIGSYGCAKTCTNALCSGTTEVSLVDDAGEPAVAQGEARREGGAARPFDCTQEETRPESFECGMDGVLRFNGHIEPDGPPPVYEVRFALRDGGWSPWQQAELELTQMTDPDFNGPGCPCTWTDGHADMMVPPGARLGS